MTAATIGTRGLFRALYLFRCGACGERGDKGELAGYDCNVVCHADCIGTTERIRDRSREPSGLAAERDAEPAYIVRGIRPIPHCPQCHCDHRGECW